MIRAFRILLIYGGQESYDLAESMRAKICNSNYPVIVTIVDNNYTGRKATESITQRIFEAIDGNDYAIVFLTKALAIQQPENEKNIYTAKPNLWLEIGYTRKMIDPKYIKYLANFPYSLIKSGEYLVASDLPNVSYEEVSDTNTVDHIWRKFSGQLCSEGILSELPVDKKDLLLFNPSYKTDFRQLFSDAELEKLSGVHPEKQYHMLWDHWLDGHREFSNADSRKYIAQYTIDQWHLLYLFERVVFLVLFPASLQQDIREFMYKNYSGMPENLEKYSKLYNAVIDYIKSHDGKQGPKTYQRIYKSIKDAYGEMENVAPIVSIIAKNYCGLACYNQVRSYVNGNMELDTEMSQKLLNEARECFTYVIENDSIDGLGDTLEVFVGFAAYNLARVCQMQGDIYNANDYFWKAIKAREALSKEKKFPKVMQLYYRSELYHAQIDYYQFAQSHPELEIELEEGLVERIKREIEEMSKTVQFSVPLFQHVLNKLKRV